MKRTRLNDVDKNSKIYDIVGRKQRKRNRNDLGFLADFAANDFQGRERIYLSIRWYRRKKKQKKESRKKSNGKKTTLFITF